MNHKIGVFQSGSTVSIKSGDCLTITVPYTDKGATQSAWNITDFNYHPHLNLDSISVDQGVSTINFIADKVGTTSFNMEEHFVLSLPGPSSFIRAFSLTVIVG